MSTKPIRIAILTASDRAYRGEYSDKATPLLKELLESELNAEIVETTVLPDELKLIAEKLTYWSDVDDCDVVFTTGGTGFTKRDVTPEATLTIIDRNAPGLAEAIRAESRLITHHAMLSRGISGIRKNTLIINLPGSPKGAVESVQVILPAIPHAVELLRGEPQSEKHHKA